MRKDRLLKLADFLETVPRRSFEIRWWQKRPATKPEGTHQGECGFAGCAVGWAAHAKLFRGLRLAQHGDGGTDATPIYDGDEGMPAVARLFDLPTVGDYFKVCPDASCLFEAESYDGHRATPLQVARRIRKFVKDAEASQ